MIDLKKEGAVQKLDEALTGLKQAYNEQQAAHRYVQHTMDTLEAIVSKEEADSAFYQLIGQGAYQTARNLAEIFGSSSSAVWTTRKEMLEHLIG